MQRAGHPNDTLFFWAFEKENGSLTTDSDEPWAIWLNGGCVPQFCAQRLSVGTDRAPGQDPRVSSDSFTRYVSRLLPLTIVCYNQCLSERTYPYRTGLFCVQEQLQLEHACGLLLDRPASVSRPALPHAYGRLIMCAVVRAGPQQISRDLVGNPMLHESVLLMLTP